jgi:hypothetical protein
VPASLFRHEIILQTRPSGYNTFPIAQAGGTDGWNFSSASNPYLQPATTYHYRLVVTNSGGTVYGSDQTFTTDYAAPTVSFSPASDITSASAILNATVTETGGTDDVAFYYGVTDDYTSMVYATPTSVLGTGSYPVSATLTGLLPNTTYHFQSWTSHSFNGNIISYTFGDQTFTTLPSGVQSWRQQYFGTTADTGSTADTASYSGDGIANLIKYALDLDPTVANPGALPTAIIKNYSGVNYLSFTFPRDPTKTELTYQVVAANAPGGPWTPIATSTGGATTTGPGFVSETPGAGGMINVEVHDTVSVVTTSARFLRLVATDSTE